MITQFDMATGEIVRTEQLDSLPSGNPPVAPVPALRLMTVEEAAIIQEKAQHVRGALLTHPDTARIDD